MSSGICSIARSRGPVAALASCAIAAIDKARPVPIASPMRLIGAKLAKGAFKSVKQRASADSYGGRHLSHGEWCREQYGRYYNPYTNTYRASDGHHYKCIRP